VGVATGGFIDAMSRDPGVNLVPYGLTLSGWRRLRSEGYSRTLPMPAGALL
jgi:hypothetical protein